MELHAQDIAALDGGGEGLDVMRTAAVSAVTGA